MVQIIIVYYVIGILMTIKFGWDDMADWVKKDNCPVPCVIAIAAFSSLLMPLTPIIGCIIGIIGMFRGD